MTVATAAHGEEQLAFACEGYRVRNVRGARAAHDHGRSLVDHAIPDASQGVVFRMTRQDQVTSQAGAEFLQRGLLDDGALAGEFHRGHGAAGCRGGLCGGSDSRER